jgi:hypothetical protein
MRKVAFALLLILVACSKYVDDRPSILERSSCELPCWSNIIPGRTSEQGAIQTISALSFVEKESILVTNKPWKTFDNQIFFSFDTKSGFKTNSPKLSEIDVSNGLVRVLTLCGDLHTTIGDVAKKIGEPEKLISGGSIAGGRDVILVNSQVGVFYWYNTKELPDATELSISPAIKLQCLSAFDPNHFNELLDTGLFSMGYYNAEQTLKVMYSWNGYGNLDTKYPPRQP